MQFLECLRSEAIFSIPIRLTELNKKEYFFVFDKQYLHTKLGNEI